jgi:organic hydroperoxide reductase OsmC/OhrA
MRSQLADAARRSLSDDVKRMTPEQRLAAFLAHCQLMAQLHGAGEAGQQSPRHVAARNAG